jgi:3-phenylpropionate/trans-cinnamate dioxygenase ferredoxin component
VTARPAQFVTVAKADQVPEGQLKVFRAAGARVAVCRLEGKFYAVEDVCTHDEGPLGEGTLRGEEVECPRHGARFNVKSGAAVSMPAVVPVKVFEVRVEGADLQVKL